MNLVGVHAVESTVEAVIQHSPSTVHFFTASKHRWKVLQSHASRKIALKSLSVTRWSARLEAVQVLEQKVFEFNWGDLKQHLRKFFGIFYFQGSMILKSKISKS